MDFPVVPAQALDMDKINHTFDIFQNCSLVLLLAFELSILNGVN